MNQLFSSCSSSVLSCEGGGGGGEYMRMKSIT